MKDKLLFISQVSPSLNGAGVQLRCARHLISLSKLFDVVLVILHKKAVTLSDIPNCCKDVIYIKQQETEPVESLFSYSFDNLYRDFSRSDIAEIAALTARFSPKKIFLFRLALAKLVFEPSLTASLCPSQWLLDLDDIESRATYRYARVSYDHLGFITTARVYGDALKLRLLENKLLNTIGRVLICSQGDKAVLAKRTSKNNIAVIPNVISEVSPLPFGKHQCNILFLGTMSYMPNEQAILYFHQEILPLINQTLQQPININVVGFQPSEKVLALQSEYFTVTGGVDSVVPYYNSAKLVVAPILSGGGTRIKIIEAMAYQRAVVATSIGAEGLGVIDGQNIHLADSAALFAQQVLELLNDDKKQQTLAINGCASVEQNFTQQTLDNLYKKLLG